jgi:SAM-dependent methyltransferase
MIRGWDTAHQRHEKPAAGPNPSIEKYDCDIIANGTTVTVTGRVLLKRPQGSWGHEIHLQQHTSHQLVRIHLQANNDTCPSSIGSWITMRGARKLLCEGVTLQVTGAVTESEDAGALDVVATKLHIVGALPATPYLARLLSLDLESLQKLFDCKESSGALLVLANALQPCTLKRCEKLNQFCLEEKKRGRFDILFKQEKLLVLCEEIRKFQGWSRGPQSAPKTSHETWSALLRMEQRWCQEVDEADAEETTSSAPVNPEDHVVYGGINVDPSLNLPDVNDERRIRYVDERKRPQVLWMLNLIRRLVEREDSDLKLSEGEASGKQQEEPLRELNFVDIGGGRGDLANAVAAFFAQPHVRVKAHVTVLDVNQSSLDAGQDRASKLNLADNMSFVLCDIADRSNVDDLCANRRFDLVFGLHCCGGLAEAAVDLAIRANASFCISTCCFRSNAHLASLSKHADAMLGTPDTGGATKQHESDRDLLSALAVVVGGQGQHRAIRTLNSMRLVAAEDRLEEDAPNQKTILKTWQESFPIEYSVQNRIMIGQFKSKA